MNNNDTYKYSKKKKKVPPTLHIGDPNSTSSTAGLFDKLRGATKTGMSQFKGIGTPAALGLGTLGAANIAGLMDNDKVGGQLLGGALGTGLGAGATKFAPQLATKLGEKAPGLLTKFAGAAGGRAAPIILGAGLAGGALGSLFDGLRNVEPTQDLYI